LPETKNIPIENQKSKSITKDKNSSKTKESSNNETFLNKILNDISMEESPEQNPNDYKNVNSSVNTSSIYTKNSKITELQKEIRKIFKVQDSIPKWVVKIINSNFYRGSKKNNDTPYQIKYSKASNSAIILIEDANFYLEIQLYGNKLFFTKKMFEIKKDMQTFKVQGNFLSICQQAGIPAKDARNISSVFKNICRIKDIESDAIRAQVSITFNIIYDSINKKTIKHISKVTVANENSSYSIYGYRNSIKYGTFYNKNGVCLVWNNISLPMKNFTLNSNYGRRLHPVLKVYKFHHGIDFIAPLSSKIYSVCSGKVIKRERIGSFGNCIFIQNVATKKVFIYAHMESFAPNTSVGTFVDMDQVIGKIGRTGRTTGVHLHLEIRNSNGESENPTEIFDHLGKRLTEDTLNEFLSGIN
jgi:murein DD-endopeptidase MepM/ murein hydrolase activator NlpD